MKQIKIKEKILKLPAFFPDATYGRIKGLNSQDLAKCQVQGLVVNIYHLLKHGLIEKIKRKGGIHKFMDFSGIVISDSGGFQVMSLIHKNPALGKINDNGAIFLLDGKKIILTPEKCIELQIRIKSDIVMCLDECMKPEASYEEQEKSVARTIKWAGRCKSEFLRLTARMKQEEKPKLFAIIQGGESRGLRKKCAEKLIEIGFDGYAFGGFPVKNGKLLKEILKYTTELMPFGLKYAMGVGKPDDIKKCVKIGYNMFDCVLPTRDARHKRLYTDKGQINIRMGNKKTRKLALLFKNNYEQAVRIATMKNLSFYSALMRKLRK